MAKMIYNIIIIIVCMMLSMAGNYVSNSLKFFVKLSQNSYSVALML